MQSSTSSGLVSWTKEQLLDLIIEQGRRNGFPSPVPSLQPQVQAKDSSSVSFHSGGQVFCPPTSQGGPSGWSPGCSSRSTPSAPSKRGSHNKRHRNHKHKGEKRVKFDATESQSTSVKAAKHSSGASRPPSDGDFKLPPVVVPQVAVSVRDNSSLQLNSGMKEFMINMSAALNHLSVPYQGLTAALREMDDTIRALMAERHVWRQHHLQLNQISTKIAGCLREMEPLFWTSLVSNSTSLQKVSFVIALHFVIILKL